MVMKTEPVRRAIQEQIKAQPTLSFIVTVVEAVAREQEDAEATVTVTKRHEPIHPKE